MDDATRNKDEVIDYIRFTQSRLIRALSALHEAESVMRLDRSEGSPAPSQAFEAVARHLREANLAFKIGVKNWDKLLPKRRR